VFYPTEEYCRYIRKAHTCPPKCTLSHPKRQLPSECIRVPAFWCGSALLYRGCFHCGHLIEISSFDAMNATQMLHWLIPSANLPFPVPSCCTLPSIEKQYKLCCSVHNEYHSYVHGRVGECESGVLLIVTLYFLQESEYAAVWVHIYIYIYIYLSINRN